MTIQIGIISDTHSGPPTADFLRTAKECFTNCSIIFHAGDLTDIAVLTAFAGKTIYGVHGNMCSRNSRDALPTKESVKIGNFTFGITHGDKLGHQIEDHLLSLFPEVDCLIYGHTHRPVCHRVGDTLIINPGTFRSTGKYGAPGTYAIVKVGDTLEAKIHEVQYLP